MQNARTLQLTYINNWGGVICKLIFNFASEYDTSLIIRHQNIYIYSKKFNLIKSTKKLG